MADELNGARLRLEWAAAHLDAMKHEAILFMTEVPQPYTFVRERNPEGGDDILRAKIFRWPDAKFGMRVADAVHNLRSVLDMIAWECALKGKRPPTETDRSVAFPICMDDSEWEDRGTKRMIRLIPDDAVTIIKSFQPYSRPDGIQGLGLVQSLDNWSKHKRLLSLPTFHASSLTAPAGCEFIDLNLGAFADNDVMALVRGTNTDLQDKGKFMAHIGFAKGPPGRGYPIDQLAFIYDQITDKVLPAFQEYFD